MPVFLIIWMPVVTIALIALAVFKPDKNVSWLVIIAAIIALAAWIALPGNPGIHVDSNGDGDYEIDKPIAIRQGLDLAGGLQVLLEADLPQGETPTKEALEEARRIVEQRVDSLGALEPVIQVQGDRRIIVELPGYDDPEQAVGLIRETAQLEFIQIPVGVMPPAQGSRVMTSMRQEAIEAAGAEAGAEAPAEGETTPADEPIYDSDTVFTTVMTGDILTDAIVQGDQYGSPMVVFQLTTEGGRVFGDYTAAHINEPLGIVLDGIVLSTPTISSAITEGTGTITGQFTREEAEKLATQLRYGALPVPLRVESTSTVGPSLGEISIEKSIRAGLIGIGVVLLFMLIYYRLPGLAAALALLVFALLNFAIFKYMPVTMTLPAITGFLISVGTAVDGNILIFERMKEELRAGKRLHIAVNAGFNRAWSAIWTSNLSTLIIAAILFIFGSSFGAGAVRGFAVTLSLGLLLNMFTAVVVTRTFLHFIMKPVTDESLASHPWLLGL